MERTRRSWMGMVAALTLLGAAHNAAATDAPELVIGERVRVTSLASPGTKARPLVGLVTGVEDEYFLIQPAKDPGAGPQRVLWSDVKRLQVHQDGNRVKRGFWTGAAAVGAVGGAFGGYVGYQACGFGEVLCSPADKAGSALLFGGVTAVASSLVGGAIGALIGALPGDDWKTVHDASTKTRLTIAPEKGGMRVALSVRF